MLRKVLIAFAAVPVLLGVALFALKPAPVPPDKIASAVTRTPALLERAWRLPAARSYRKGLRYQTNGSVCGPSSLANAFGSLGEAATSESAVLEGTGLCRLGFCFMGLTLDQLATVAKARTQRKVSVLRGLSAETFREHLLRSNDPAHRYIVNFTRKPIFGAGGGHHSPIGGYLPDEDLVFVLDVNRDFKPWLIERSRLYAAVDTLDGDLKRGLLAIEQRSR